MSEIVLTADKTLMSDHHGSEFLGFGTCIPPYILPTSIYKILFFPSIKTNKIGEPIAAPYGMRKIESALIDRGFDVRVLDPRYIDKGLKDAKVLGISTMDPFGWGPASSTFARILKRGDVFASRAFKELLKQANRYDVKTIVGGPGAWQFKYAPEFLDENKIDCVVYGESDLAIQEFAASVLNGDELPKFYDIPNSQAPSLDEISDIKAPSINGLIEIGRGCPRGCPFCEVTLRKLRWYPLDKIERELRTNTDFGVERGIIHAEDVLLYGVKGVVPSIDKLAPMFDLFSRYYKVTSFSHLSIASINACPEAIELANEKFLKHRPGRWFGTEIGIETGSPRLIEKTMAAKAKPFDPKDWQELVKNAFGILHDNSIVPVCTLISGLPEETEDDTIKTLELMDDVREYRALIVPLFFVPMGKLKDKDWFSAEDITEPQIELLKKCLSQGIYWSKDLVKGYSESPLVNFALSSFVSLLRFIGKRKGLI